MNAETTKALFRKQAFFKGLSEQQIEAVGALAREVRFERGRVVDPTLGGYPVPRFADVPAIETVLVDRPDLPSVGGSETPIIAVAPAIANALFACTGERIRTMPIRAEGLAPGEPG